MQTVPVVGTIPDTKPNSFAQTVKDWVAEQASNVLLNRLYPTESASSSEDEDEKQEDEEDGELEEVVVIGAPTVYSSETVAITDHRPSLAEHIEPNGGLPTISIHECTPSSEADHKIGVKKPRKRQFKISETVSTDSDKEKKKGKSH
jgi:hypothetical protein